jgi:hypothetical protein
MPLSGVLKISTPRGGNSCALTSAFAKSPSAELDA